MVEKFKAWGCNVDEALERFVDDRDLYVTCFNMFLADTTFDALKQSVESGDCKAAFEACHTLKGVSGNLSAGPLYDAICSLTEKLRAGSMDGAADDVCTILKYKDEAIALLAG